MVVGWGWVCWLGLVVGWGCVCWLGLVVAGWGWWLCKLFCVTCCVVLFWVGGWPVGVLVGGWLLANPQNIGVYLVGVGVGLVGWACANHVIIACRVVSVTQGVISACIWACGGRGLLAIKACRVGPCI